MNNLTLITTQTPLGDFHMIAEPSREANQEIVRASGFGSPAELAARLPKELRDVPLSLTKGHPHQAWVGAYFDGDMSALKNIPATQAGSDFYHAVWRAMNAVSPGKTISYKELAANASNPTAIRAAGTACGMNRLILLVPCHRILKSDGSIGSYLYGPKRKEELLRLEGALA
jgi:methylated-DNA-[protein]-cysteine S-methyltransferase